MCQMGKPTFHGHGLANGTSALHSVLPSKHKWHQILQIEQHLSLSTPSSTDFNPRMQQHFSQWSGSSRRSVLNFHVLNSPSTFEDMHTDRPEISQLEAKKPKLSTANGCPCFANKRNGWQAIVLSVFTFILSCEPRLWETVAKQFE